MTAFRMILMSSAYKITSMSLKQIEKSYWTEIIKRKGPRKMNSKRVGIHFTSRGITSKLLQKNTIDAESFQFGEQYLVFNAAEGIIQIKTKRITIYIKLNPIHKSGEGWLGTVLINIVFINFFINPRRYYRRHECCIEYNWSSQKLRKYLYWIYTEKNYKYLLFKYNVNQLFYKPISLKVIAVTRNVYGQWISKYTINELYNTDIWSSFDQS